MIDCTKFDLMYCSIIWALKDMKDFLIFLLGVLIGKLLERRDNRDKLRNNRKNEKK